RASCRLPPAVWLLPSGSCRLPTAVCRLAPADCLLPSAGAAAMARRLAVTAPAPAHMFATHAAAHVAVGGAAVGILSEGSAFINNTSQTHDGHQGQGKEHTFSHAELLLLKT